MNYHIVFEEPPVRDDAEVYSKDQIAAALKRRKGRYAIVARVDRRVRAEAMVARINEGREYGEGHEAVTFQCGPEHRVYARRLAG